ncbi:MAG: HEAT repeat domain-containing protein [Cyanobacteria bacterium]|nr:HEAT repeat domain-containing protein [Cyanobacteriota bacterium]
MNINQLAQVVDEMIIQHDYPGGEPRALKLGLPESVNKAPAKVFAQALGHESVYVKLASLRWFQERPGMMKSHIAALTGLIDHEDEFVRLETIRALERYPYPTSAIVTKVSKRLQDEDVEVKREAAKACGKMCSKLKLSEGVVIEALKIASQDVDGQLRGKAEKALRKIGVYD